MDAERDLDRMLAKMRPVLREGAFVFLAVPAAVAGVLQPVMTFAEDEGLTVIVAQREAEAAGLPCEPAMAWLTLSVHSSLEGVGLTAAVSTALADAGISCNVVAAAHHDHLFVPVGRGEEARALLEALASRAPAPPGRRADQRNGSDQR